MAQEASEGNALKQGVKLQNRVSLQFKRPYFSSLSEDLVVFSK